MNKKNSSKTILSVLVLVGLLLSGCSTNRVIGEGTRDLFTKYESGTESITLVEDEVIAFGKSSTVLPSEPKDSIVIAGKKYSYVISKGGSDFIQLISQLDPKYIHIERDLNFFTPNLDSNRFSGYLRFSYLTPNGKLSTQESFLFQQYGVKPCDFCSSKTQNYVFDIELAGTIYPIAENLQSLKSLSKPYQITIKSSHYKSGKVKLSTSEKLANIPLLPITLTLDALILPAKVLGIIYQP